MKAKTSRRSSAPLADKVPPLPQGAAQLRDSEEVERAVLATVLLVPAAWELVSDQLTVDDFGLEIHRRLFEAMAAVVKAGHVIDPLTLQTQLEEAGTLDAVGGKATLYTLDTELPDTGRVEIYVEIVRDRALRRRLSETGWQLARRAFEPGTSGREILAEAEGTILKLGEGMASRRLRRAGEVVAGTAETLEEAPGSLVPELSWGLDGADRLLGGLGRGRLLVLAGRPGKGKTSLALAVAHHLTASQGRTVAYFSLEMTCRELALRLLATETGIPSDRLEKGILSRPQWAALHAAVARLRNIPLYLDDSGTLTLWQLASTVRRLKAQRGLDAVLIDYLQLLHPSESYPNETAALAALSRGLKQLAKELDIPVLVVSQLSREPERRGPAARPQLSDLRGSGSIEQDANAVLFLWSPGLGAAQAANLELIVAKNRNGATGEVLLDFRGDTLRFAEVPSP